MSSVQKVVIPLILLLLQVSEIHSLSNQTETEIQSQSQDGGGGMEPEGIKYETKYCVGNIHVPSGLIRSDYNNFELPPGPRNENGSVCVEISVRLYSLPDFQEDKEELSIDWIFSIAWSDNRFDGFAHSQLVNKHENVSLDGRLLHRVWNPRIHLDSLKSTSQASLMGAPAILIITPKENSTVFYGSRSMIQSICETDYTYYPFDVIVCPMNLLSTFYNAQDVLLCPGALDCEKLEVPGFHVYRTGWQQAISGFEDLRFSTLSFEILLKRDVTSSMIQFYIPSLVFIIICFGSFTLRETSDRITCTTVSLLSLFVLLGSIGSTPQGPYVTYLHKWVLMCILIVFLPIVEIFISLKLKTLAEIRAEEKEIGKPEDKNEEDQVHRTTKAREAEGRRRSKLLRMIWLLETVTPVVVISTFIIYNIYYWSVLITGARVKFQQHMDQNLTLT